MTFQENVILQYQHYPGISSLENGIWQGPSTSIRAPGGNSMFFSSKRHSIPRISIFAVCGWVWSSLLHRHFPPSIAGNLPTPRPALNPGVHSRRSGVRMMTACLCTLKDTHSWLFYATLHTTDHVVGREHNAENNSWKTITLNKLWVATDGGGGFKKPLIVLLPCIIFNVPDIIILIYCSKGGIGSMLSILFPEWLILSTWIVSKLDQEYHFRKT